MGFFTGRDYAGLRCRSWERALEVVKRRTGTEFESHPLRQRVSEFQTFYALMREMPACARHRRDPRGSEKILIVTYPPIFVGIFSVRQLDVPVRALLYTSRKHRRPGPKGPSKELIGAVIEMKRRPPPRFGYRKIAEQISSSFGIELNKDVVRRILIRYYRPGPGGDGPAWLTLIGHAKDSLWSVDFFRCESILLKSYWIMIVMDVFTRRIIGFGVAPADLDGQVVCRMFNRAIAKQTPPKYLSSDNDPRFRFHRWLANLRILEVDETKTIPCTPPSHAFVERLIGTVRREYLDRTLFWNRGDLERKLDNYLAYYNQHHCHTGLAGATPAQRSGAPAQPIANLESYTWRQHCNGLFQTPTAA